MKQLRFAAFVCGALFPGLTLWALYRRGSPWYPVLSTPWLHLLLYAAVCGVVMVVLAGLIRRWAASWGQAFVVAIVPMWGLMFFVRVTAVVNHYSPWSLANWITFSIAMLLVVLVGVLHGVLVSRVADLDAPLMVGIVMMALVSAVQLAAGVESLSDGPSVIEVPGLVGNPNVWVLVFDEMAAPGYLEEISGRPNRILGVLEDVGLEAPARPSSPYDATYPSLGSMLSLKPLTPGIYPSADLDEVAKVFVGTHPLAEAFLAEGLAVVFVEPIISPSGCGRFVSECVSSSVDQFDGFLLENSVIGRLPTIQALMPLSGLTQMDRLDEIAAVQADGRLVMAHVMLPHSPFVLDASCSLSASSPALIDAYVSQVDCLTDRLEQLLAAIPDDDIVLIVGDHGLRTDPINVHSDSHIAASHEPLVALRGCKTHGSDLTSNINAYRALVSCVTDTTYPPLDLPEMATCYLRDGGFELIDVSSGPVACDDPAHLAP